MIKDIFGTFGHIIANILISVLVGVFFEIDISIIYVYVTGTHGIGVLQDSFSRNQVHIPTLLNNIFDYLYNSMDHSSLGALSTLSANILKAIYLSAVIYLQKISIVLISLYLYVFIVVIFIFDGLIAREIRRYRAGVESVRRKEFEGYATCIEIPMFLLYLSIPIYIPASIWFICFGFFVAYFHRMKFQYIQKYL
jgi:hypothetical protein